MNTICYFLRKCPPKHIRQTTDSTKQEVDDLLDNVDTLKKGQVIIYDQVKKQQKTLWEELKEVVK